MNILQAFIHLINQNLFCRKPKLILQTCNYSWVILITLSLSVFNVQAQQWNGNNNPNDPISRFGNVGIGIANPSRPFQLRGSNSVLQIDRDTKDPGFGVTRYSPGFGEVWKSFFFYTEGNSPNNGRFIIADWGTNTKGPSTPRLVIGNTGNIGLGGELNPAYPLEINGTATTGIQYNGRQTTFAFAGTYMNGGLPFYGYKRDNSILAYHYMTSNNTWVLNNSGAHLGVTSSGNVGIGTISPSHKLHVNDDGWQMRINNNGTNGDDWYIGSSNSDWNVGSGKFVISPTSGSNNSAFTITSSKNVGIGTTSPSQRLHVSGNLLVSPGKIYLATSNNNDDVDDGMGLEKVNNLHMAIFSDQTISFMESDTKVSKIFIDVNTGRMGIGTSSPTSALEVNGTTKTNILTITGGADIAEPFEVSDNEVEMLPGTLMIIDEDNPGNLKPSQTAYDKKVAGIISGAQGINPGLILNQEEKLGKGPNIALTGRVYVKANTSNGAIKAGDLLTSSDIMGEAMRVTDFDKANGAVIGKAMTTLENGSGYIMVLVSLQ